MKSTCIKAVLVSLILLLGLPSLVIEAPAADKKKVKAQNTSIPNTATEAKTSAVSGRDDKMDKAWNSDNKILLGLVKDKKFDEAIAKSQAMLSDLKSRNIPEGPEAATTYNNLGMIYISMGKLDKALDNLSKALDLRRKIYGENSMEIALVWQNLSELYKIQAQSIREKKLDEELQKAQSTLDAMNDESKESPEAASAHNTIGTIFLSRGQIGKAQTHLTKALAIYSKLSGDRNAEMAAISQNLAEVYRLQAQYVQQMNNKKEETKK